MRFFAIWENANGTKGWAGPFDDNRDAANAVPDTAISSVVLRPIPMTPGEAREASLIMR